MKFSYQNLLRTLEDEQKQPMSQRVRAVLQTSFDAHRGQFRSTRKSQQQVPYIVHPVGTARLAIKYFPLVSSLEDDLNTILCIALAHDLLEDTDVDRSIIEAVAGKRVLYCVDALTKPSAGVAGRTAEERNREFMSHILRAGSTAVFVKICDSMNNLSRPQLTPTELFAKVLSKAKNEYMSLLQQCPLGDVFMEAYLETIREAERSTISEISASPPQVGAPSLEAAVEECMVAATGKILEMHDITTILTNISGTTGVTIWRQGSKAGHLLTQVSGPEHLDTMHSGQAERSVETPQFLKGTATRSFPTNLSGQDYAYLYIVPMQVSQALRFVVMIGYSIEPPPSWLSLTSVTMLVQFLAHRLILGETNQRMQLAATAARLGMQVDIGLALQLGIQPGDLGSLQRWRERCDQAIMVVQHLISLWHLSRSHETSMNDLVRFQSRVKTPDSILRKILSSKKYIWTRLEDMEDIAGVRVICPTRGYLNDIEDFLNGDRAATAGVRPHTRLTDVRRDYSSVPTQDGYRAIHLIVEVQTHTVDNEELAVPCEIQLRTIFQDAWAVISHASSYKYPKNARKHSVTLLELGKALEGCEGLAEQILDGR